MLYHQIPRRRIVEQNEKSPKQPIFVGRNCLGQQKVEAPL